MLEEVRVHVDQDTEAILEKITQGIADHLSETPFWTREFSSDLKEQLAEAPGWVELEREKLTQSLRQGLDRIESAVRASQDFEQGVLKRLNELIEASGFVAEEQNTLKEYMQRDENNEHLFREEIKEQVERITDSLRTVQGESQQRFELLEVRHQELGNIISALVELTQAQSATLAACHNELILLNKPWWKKLFRRGK